jgi:hypothetical protein
VDNIDAPVHSLELLGESAKSVKEALRQGFVMGIRMAQFNTTKNLEGEGVFYAPTRTSIVQNQWART